MAFSKLFVCDACDDDIVVTLAEAFASGMGSGYPRFDGYGLVGGLVSRLWCASCGTVRDFPLVTLSPSASHAVVAFAEAQRLGLHGDETGPCSVCDGPLTADASGAPCPACETGTLRHCGEWDDGG